MPEVCFYSPSQDRSWVVVEQPSLDFLEQFPYPEDTIEVPLPPTNGGLPRYDGDQFRWEAIEPVEVVPDSVTARQFKLQLLAAGLLDQVDAWIASQDRATQVAYEYSGTFVRNEPMMQAGFTAMGFTPQQVEAFFIAASKL
jgi:hypothetical protein|nr:hypothetical protein [Neorhizobium tomejilense]